MFPVLMFIRSSHSQMFFKIGVLANFTNFTEKHLCWSQLLIKLLVLRLINLLKRDSNTRDFQHVKFLRKSCFTEHLSLLAASGLWLITPAKFILGSLMVIFHLWCHHLHIKDVSYYSYICPRLLITAGEIINKLSDEALKSVQVNYFSGIVNGNRISSLRGVFRTLPNICDCTFCENNETLRSSRPDVFCKKGVVRNFTKLFSCEVCEISKNTFFHRKSLFGASETLIAVNYFGKITHLGCSAGFSIGLC